MMNRFEDLLQKLESYHMEVDIIGDLNCNVGATSPDCITQKLLDISHIVTSRGGGKLLPIHS